MGIKFATDEWAKALMHEVNNSEAYAKAAAHWEGDFYFITTAGPAMPKDTYLYLDLWHGKARDAYLVEDPTNKPVAFELRAPLAHTLAGELNGIIFRQDQRLLIFDDVREPAIGHDVPFTLGMEMCIRDRGKGAARKGGSGVP